jgi:hypothetical protein
MLRPLVKICELRLANSAVLLLRKHTNSSEGANVNRWGRRPSPKVVAYIVRPEGGSSTTGSAEAEHRKPSEDHIRFVTSSNGE